MKGHYIIIHGSSHSKTGCNFGPVTELSKWLGNYHGKINK